MSRRNVTLGVSCLLLLLCIAWAISPIGLGAFATNLNSQPGVTPSQVFSPYQDVSVGPDLQSVVQNTGQKYYTLAFLIAGGQKCQVSWDGTVPLDQTATYFPHLDSDISYIRQEGGDVTFSFGGQAGQEVSQTCNDASQIQAAYQAVVTKYQATHLDFDIEGGEEGDARTYKLRNQALAALQQANPGLKISFTLPSNPTGLEQTSLGLLQDAIAQGVAISSVNLMTMDYGPADNQMGQDAIRAGKALFLQLKTLYPNKSDSELWSMVGICPMIGQNDSAGEVFTLDDATQLLAFAQQFHLGSLTMWEVSRDNGSRGDSHKANDTSSGIQQSDYAYTNIFKEFTQTSTCLSATATAIPGGTATSVSTVIPDGTATPTGTVSPDETAISTTPTPVPPLDATSTDVPTNSGTMATPSASVTPPANCVDCPSSLMSGTATSVAATASATSVEPDASATSTVEPDMTSTAVPDMTSTVLPDATNTAEPVVSGTACATDPGNISGCTGTPEPGATPLSTGTSIAIPGCEGTPGVEGTPGIILTPCATIPTIRPERAHRNIICPVSGRH